MCFRVHDIFENRVLHVLDSMNLVNLHILPEESPWTMDQFHEKMEDKCIQGALVYILYFTNNKSTFMNSIKVFRLLGIK